MEKKNLITNHTHTKKRNIQNNHILCVFSFDLRELGSEDQGIHRTSDNKLVRFWMFVLFTDRSRPQHVWGRRKNAKASGCNTHNLAGRLGSSNRNSGGVSAHCRHMAAYTKTTTTTQQRVNLPEAKPTIIPSDAFLHWDATKNKSSAWTCWNFCFGKGGWRSRARLVWSGLVRAASFACTDRRSLGANQCQLFNRKR